MKNKIVKRFESKKFEDFKKPLVLIKVGDDARHTLRFAKKAKFGKKEFVWVPWDIPMGIKDNYLKELLGKLFYWYFRDSRGYLNYFEFINDADKRAALIRVGDVFKVYRGYKVSYGRWDEL